MNKKIIIIITSIILLVVGFFIYYKYYAKGTLEIISETPEVDISVEQLNYLKTSIVKVSLKPGMYTVNISKESYLSTTLNINIDRFKKNTIKLALGKVIGKLSNTGFDEDTSFSELIDNKIYSYNKSENAFYVFSLEKQSNTKLFDLPQELHELTINNVLFSPKGDKTIISSQNIDTVDYFTINFLDGKFYRMSNNITEICWINNDKIAYFYDSYLSVADYTGLNWQNIFNSNFVRYGLMRIDDRNISYFLINGEKIEIHFVDLENNKDEKIPLTDARQMIVPIGIWKNNFLIVYFGEKHYLVSAIEKNIKELPVNPYENLVAWINNNKLIYLDLLDNNNYVIYESDLSKINEIFSSYTDQNISKIFYYQNKILLLTGGDLVEIYKYEK